MKRRQPLPRPAWWRRDARLDLGGTSRIGRPAVRRSRAGVLLAIIALGSVGAALGLWSTRGEPPPRLGADDGERMTRLPVGSNSVLHPDDDRVRLGRAVAWQGALADGRPTSGLNSPDHRDLALTTRARLYVEAQPLLQAGSPAVAAALADATPASSAAVPARRGGVASDAGRHHIASSGVWARIDHDPYLGPRPLELRNDSGADYIFRLTGPGAATALIEGMPLVPGRNYPLSARIDIDAPEPCTVLIRPRSGEQRIHGLPPPTGSG